MKKCEHIIKVTLKEDITRKHWLEGVYKSKCPYCNAITSITMARLEEYPHITLAVCVKYMSTVEKRR